MPVTSSPYFNNPQIGQGFANLAQMFAPPSGSELAGYATANAKRQEAAGLSEMLDYAKNVEGFNKDVFDRMAVANGRGTIANGYYGVDTTAATSRSNNAMDNARALREREMQEAGALARLYATPVTAAEGATVFLPKQTQDATGLAGVLSGNISASPGEQITTPNGRVISGPMKPLSEAEWKAQQQERLRASGQLTDQMMLDNIMGDQAPVHAIDPTTNRARFMAPGEAVRTGAQPAAPISSAAPETQNYQTPDGKRGTAVFDQTKRTWVDTATGTALPQGAITFNSSLQGGAADTGLGPTTANNTAANSQGAQITQALNTLDLYEKLVRNNPAAVGFAGMVRGTAQNAVAATQDLATAFGGNVPRAQEYAAEIRQGLSNVAPELFDPDVNEANFLQGTLAYAIARTENPSGEVSRQAYERALERINGGLLANSQSILSNIGAYRKVLQQQLPAVDALRNPASARTDTSFRPPVVGASPPGPRVFDTPQGRVTIQREN